ncbi:hypothetical protein K469DRAFT_682845 [Zopfia rhizophila CBS 207.26]|uniref:Transposase Tc1-like domain-containing protein n=1 Tax=Zopfia rhizophila CBS 207.26 TaxID=1314779 RepID=A0A6A6DC87_9PEZI|nr:hypothetical protein K469DRAFT_682845 [Zopfia rhizophila CBS 207.26]
MSKAEETELPIYDSYIWQKDHGNRGRLSVLTQEQKGEIVRRATADDVHRYTESWQFVDEDLQWLPQISRELFENVIYEAGYSRGKPGCKPELTEWDKDRRFEWAKAHNPDKYDLYDNRGFNFRRATYPDETPAKTGAQRGTKGAQFRDEEEYHHDVKRNRTIKSSETRFDGCFTYGFKGPCHVYSRETK